MVGLAIFGMFLKNFIVIVYMKKFIINVFGSVFEDFSEDFFECILKYF